MLSDDPTASPPIKPPTVTSRNPALCDQCNKCLVLDDSVVEPYLRTTRKQVLCIGRSSPSPYGESAMFGGIEYTRKDDLPDLPALSSAADNGCEFCAAVREGLKTKYEGAPWWRAGSEPLSLRMQYAWKSTGDAGGRTGLHSVVVSVTQDETQGWEKSALQFLVWATEGKDACNKWLCTPRWGSEGRWAEDNERWSLNNISMVKSWIHNCVSQSGCCEGKRASQDASGDIGASIDIDDSGCLFLPTRLLDLFPDLAPQSDNTTPGDIKLLKTGSLRRQNEGASDQIEGLRYAALSYCWGGVDPAAKTDNANFKHGYRYIEVSSLPQCLKDAVSVTRDLGIRYLWVDALCIIQDDTRDWAIEAGKMFDVFRNAFLTIGAASSTSFDDGFLKYRPQWISIPFSSSLNSQVRGRITLSTIPVFPSWPDDFFPSTNAIERDLAASKWNKRGWVWQEQMLSERLLIFGDEMIHFKCTHYIQSENNIYEENSHTARDATRQEWTRWVQQYSKMQLTYVQDKLPAVSGMAKLMDQKSLSAGERPAEYLAGIWRSSQEEVTHRGWRGQLCWGLSGQASTFKEMLEGLKSSAAETYSAPSWSWASRREGVHWKVLDFPFAEGYASRKAPQKFQARFEQYHAILMGPDPMGCVMPGSYLKVSGLMRRATLPLSTAEPRHAGAALEWGLPSSESLEFSLDWRRTPGQDNEIIEGRISLFGLWRSANKYHDSFSGLLLLQSIADGFFYRVGVFHLRSWIFYDGKWPKLDKLENDFVDWQQTSVTIK